MFHPQDSARLQRALQAIDANPYARYGEFEAHVDAMIRDGQVPSAFLDCCAARRNADSYEDPYVVLRNCPVDQALPYLDFDDPVGDKRARKNTYVAEAFLLLYAKLMGQEPIGYANVNDGDIFQDIHPKKSLADTQSQKAMKPIYFHKDLANHFVRPDWVNILGLRASPQNQVYTSHVRNKDLLAELGEDICADLRRQEFHTPYDDLTLHNSKVQLGEAEVHPVQGGATPTDIRFFENRTRGLNPRAARAVEAVIAAFAQTQEARADPAGRPGRRRQQRLPAQQGRGAGAGPGCAAQPLADENGQRALAGPACEVLRGRPAPRGQRLRRLAMRMSFPLDHFHLASHAMPAHIAIRHGDRTCSYAELRGASDRVATRLHALGAGPGTTVGIALDRSIEWVVAMLGILKCGAAYLPLDPAYPEDRLALYLADSEARYVIGDGRHPRLGTPETLSIDTLAAPGRGGGRARHPGRRGRRWRAPGLSALYVRLHRPAQGRRGVPRCPGLPDELVHTRIRVQRRRRLPAQDPHGLRRIGVGVPWRR